MMRSIVAGLIAATVTYFGLSAAAHAQTYTTAPRTAGPAAVGGLTARVPDLIPIPSRIEHGVVSVRNAGTATTAPSIVTINCHVPGQSGGCTDIPARYLRTYTNPAYPNMLVVQVPAIAPGHVYNHTLPFFAGMSWASGSYQFDYTADASATNAESNEANNTDSHIWVVP